MSTAKKSSLRSQRLLQILGCVVLVVGLAACNPSAEAAYEGPRAALAELDLEDAGKVLTSNCYGADSIDGTPICVAVIGGETSERKLRKALERADYDVVLDENGQSSWRRDTGSTYSSIELLDLDDGHAFGIGTGTPYVIEGKGSAIVVRVY